MGVLKMYYYEIDTLEVAIYPVGHSYQYYLRDYTDDSDYFKFVFELDTLWGADELAERVDYLWDCQNSFYS